MGEDTELSDAEVFAPSDAVEIFDVGSGYDFRRYAKHGPYFLCKDGLPLRDSSQWNTKGWRVCAAEMGREESIKKFAETLAAKDATIEDLSRDLEASRKRIAELETENHDEPERRASVASGCIPADTFLRLRDWLASEPRKLSSNAFTAGIERQLAYTIEHSGVLAELESSRGRVAFLDKAVDDQISVTNRVAAELAAKDAGIASLEEALEPFAEWARLTKTSHPTMDVNDHILEAKIEDSPAVYVVHWEAFLIAWRARTLLGGKEDA